MSRLGFIESRRINRIDTPDELLQQIARTITAGWTTDSLDYEHRYIEIHHPTRLCPNCREIAQLQVVVNTDTGTRTRNCPECNAVIQDEHITSEQIQKRVDRGLPQGVRLQATPRGDE